MEGNQKLESCKQLGYESQNPVAFRRQIWAIWREQSFQPFHKLIVTQSSTRDTEPGLLAISYDFIACVLKQNKKITNSFGRKHSP